MFSTKVGKLRYNVREILCNGKYQSSLGYAANLKDAKELATRDNAKHTQVVDSAGNVKFEQRQTA